MRSIAWRETIVVFILFAVLFGGLAHAREVKEKVDVAYIDPAYPDPCYQFKDNEFATLLFKTTPEALRRLVPEPLMPLPANIAWIYMCRLNVIHGSITFSYLEAGIGVPVMYNGSIANYVVAMYLDKTLPVSIGREVWGFNKKGAGITFEKNGNHLVGTVERFGKQIIAFDFEIGEKVPPESAPPGLPFYTLKIIPSVVKGAPPEVKQITSWEVENNKVHTLHKGTGTFTFRSGEFDSLGEIPVLGILPGSYTVNEFLIDHGAIVFDYLKSAEDNPIKKK